MKTNSSSSKETTDLILETIIQMQTIQNWKLNPVKSAQLHQAAMCTGSNTTLNEVKLPNAKLYYQPLVGLHIYRNGKHHFIPQANVSEVEVLPY